MIDALWQDVFSLNDAKVTCLKEHFSLSFVSGSLKGSLSRLGDMVYASINNTDVTITHIKAMLIAAFCDNSIVLGAVFFLNVFDISC